MPRTNYIVAWHDLKDIIAAATRAGIPSFDPNSILYLMLTLEHPGLDWSKLDEILQHLKSPPDHR